MELTGIRRRIISNAPHLATKTGNMIEIKRAEKANVKRFEIAFDQPEIQDLHGYAKPWIGGESKNLFDQENATQYKRYFSNNTWKKTSSDAASFAFQCEENADYIISAFLDTLTIFRIGYITVPIPTSDSESPALYNVVGLTKPGTAQFHTGADATYIIIQVNYASRDTVKLQVEKGVSTATNLFDASTAGNTWVDTQNQVIQRITAFTNVIDVVAGDSVYLNADVAPTADNVYLIAFLDSSDALLSRSTRTSGTTGLNAIAPANAAKCIAGFSDYDEAGITQPVIKKLTATYEPYENYCPINGGISGCNIFDTKSNLFSGEAFANALKGAVPSATIDTTEKTVSFAASATAENPTIVASDSYNGIAQMRIPFKANTQYSIYLTGYNINTSTYTTNLRVIYTDDTYSNMLFPTATAVKGTRIEVTEAGKTVSRIVKIWSKGDTVLYYDEFGIFEGDILLSQFEPYSVNKLPVSWDTQAGTIFEGSLNLLTGVLHVDDILWTLTGEENWSHMWGTSTENGVFRLNNLPFVPDTASNVLANFSTQSGRVVSGYTTMGFYVHRANRYLNVRNHICALLGDRTTTEVVNEWKALLAQRYAAGKPYAILMRGVDQTYQLTAQQLKLFTGRNFVWSDHGTTTLKFWTH